jgi:hypothetical protein
MRKRTLIATGAVVGVMGLSASSAMAAAPDRASDPFVCPVLKISDQAAVQSDQFAPISGGDYTILPGNAGSQDTFNGNVPTNATNSDGAGSPGGAHASPGDAGYSAVWSGN